MRKTYKAGLSLLVLLCMGVCALPARAQEAAAENRTKLIQFAANNLDFDAQVSQAARFIFRRQINACQTIEQVVRQMPTAYGYLAFPPVENDKSFPAPVSGIWSEHVKIRGCGKVWQVNMLAIGREGVKPLVLALLPGNTLSDPASQRTAEHIGAIAIARTDATCAANAGATYTNILGYKQENGTLGQADAGLGWFEEWLFDFCQKTVPTQMAFLPDGSGGYDIRARVIGTPPPQIPQPKPAPGFTADPPPPAQPQPDSGVNANIQSN